MLVAVPPRVTSTLAVWPAPRVTPPRLMVKVAVSGVSSEMDAVEVMPKTTASVSVMSVLAVAVVMPVVPLALVGLMSCSVRASVPSTRASSAAVRSKLNVVPTKLLPSKVRVLPLRVRPGTGRAASMAVNRVWVVSVAVSAPPARSAMSTLTMLPALTASLRVMVKVTVSPASSLMLATSRLRARVTCWPVCVVVKFAANSELSP